MAADRSVPVRLYSGATELRGIGSVVAAMLSHPNQSPFLIWFAAASWTALSSLGQSPAPTGPALQQARDPDQAASSVVRFDDVVIELGKHLSVEAFDRCSPPDDSDSDEEAGALDESAGDESLDNLTDLGRHIAVIPGSPRPDGSMRSPLVAFVAFAPGGELWILGPNSPTLECIALPAKHDEAWFGSSLTLAGDLDGDGARDLFVGAQRKGQTGNAFHAYSTAKREWLHRVALTSELKDSSPIKMQDLDQDGVEDFAFIAARGSGAEVAEEQPWARIAITSGATGESIRTLRLDTRVLSGRDGILLSIPGGTERAPLLVAAGDDLAAFDVTEGTQRWSYSEGPEPITIMDLCLTPDLNGDGCPEVLIGVLNTGREGRLVWLSGSTGERLRTSGPIDHDFGDAGFSLAPFADWDNDGLRDSIATRYRGAWSSVLVISSRTGEALFEIADPFDWDNGRYLDGSVDWDGGGLPDLVLGSNVPTTGGVGEELCILSMENHCVLTLMNSDDLPRVSESDNDENQR